MQHLPLSASVAATVLALAVAGCTGQSTSSSSDDGDSQSIKYLIEEPEDASALKALEAHIGDFEKDSGISVELKTLDTSTMRTVLQTQLRSGEGPDVFNWGSGPGYGGALAKAGLVYDMTDAYAKYNWPVYDFAKDRVTVDGKIYGVPGEMETIGVFYNKEIFANLGLDEPTSVDDLMAASKTIKAEGLVPMAVGDKEGWEGGHLLSMALSSDIGSSGMEALLNGDQSWDSPEVVAALDLWKSANDSGYLTESPTSVDYDNSIALFYSGDAAMLPTGSWLVGEIDDNTKFEVGYIPFPAPDAAGIFTGGLGSGPYISAASSKIDAALEFVNFLASPEHGQWTVENLHTIPPIPLKTDGLDVSPLFAKVLEDTATLSTTGDFGYNIDVLSTDAFNEAMWDGVQAVLTGQQSTEQVAADLEAAAQK